MSPPLAQITPSLQPPAELLARNTWMILLLSQSPPFHCFQKAASHQESFLIWSPQVGEGKTQNVGVLAQCHTFHPKQILSYTALFRGSRCSAVLSNNSWNWGGYGCGGGGCWQPLAFACLRATTCAERDAASVGGLPTHSAPLPGSSQGGGGCCRWAWGTCALVSGQEHLQNVCPFLSFELLKCPAPRACMLTCIFPQGAL